MTFPTPGQPLRDTGRRGVGALLGPDPGTAHPTAAVPLGTAQLVAVEMLHTEGCPNATDYLPRLRRLLAVAGVNQPVVVRLIADPEQAQRERFLGSPTIRVQGRDVDPGADARRDYGLSCRLYAGSDGLRGTPPDEWVLALLHPDTADPQREQNSQADQGHR